MSVGMLAFPLLAIALIAHAQAPAEQAAFHAKVASLYAFEPHTLDKKQIAEKSKLLDAFWDEVKASQARALPLLRNELRDTSNSAFFSYDGAKLLLSLSESKEDRALALEAIPRADLRSIQPTDYLRTVHWFARNDYDTTKAAIRILDYPDFKAFIPQHVLTLGQNYSLIYMLFPLPESRYLAPLIERLGVETRPESQKSILLLLWYTITPEGKAALARFAADESKPKETRDFARSLGARRFPANPNVTAVDQLRFERRKMMHRLSDEALIEFDRLTAQILAAE